MSCVIHYKATKSFHFKKTLRQIQFQEDFDKNKCITRGREEGGRGEDGLPFIKIGKKCHYLEEEMLWLWSSKGNISHSKCNFEEFPSKKMGIFSLWGFSFLQVNVYQGVLIPRKLTCLFWLLAWKCCEYLQTLYKW